MSRIFQTILTVICGLGLVAGLMLPHYPILAWISVLAGSPFAIMTGIEALKDRQLDVNVLMIVAAAGSIALGHVIEAAVLLFLFSLSSTLEEYAMARTESAIEGLIKLRPDQAMVIDSAGDRTVFVTEVTLGQHVRIKPFEVVPLDGVIVSGESSIDQSAMTGESIPVSKVVGDRVIGGTLNQDGMLVVEVESVVGDTTLEKIVALVKDAQENKASGERISSWFGQTYTLVVIGVAILSVIIRFALGQPAEQALYASLTLLVAMSPCALVISTPATTLSALAWAAKNGMLIRGGSFVELAGRANAIALDKTGTLTVGRPVLEEICVCGSAVTTVGESSVCLEEGACWSGGQTMSEDAKKALRLAAAAEQYSTHPLASAIVEAAQLQGIDIPEGVESKAVSGYGVTAKIDNVMVKIGQLKFFEDLPSEFLVHVQEIQSQGMTVAVLQAESALAAFGLKDMPRQEAPEVIQDLRTLGFNSISMLTGDNLQTAAAVATELGIKDVNASLLPAEKEAIIEELSKNSKGVIFVGDGINDAPSLSRAAVGVAMGGLGSDVALNAADVVLMHDNLKKLSQLVRLGRKTNRTIKSNLIFALTVVASLSLGTVIIPMIWPLLKNAILPFAVIGHEGSTVLVILNGLRLLKGP